MKIPTYVINLKFRIDRLKHIEKEFEGRDEFQLNIVEAHNHKYGRVGLWNTIRYIIQNLINPEDDFILICEDDHLFTSDYSKEKIRDSIAEAQRHYADVLSGGVSWFEDAVPISDDLFSVKKHFIISNSSFAWWAAWLSRNPNKVVIAPKTWFTVKHINTRDLFYPNWILI